VNRRALVLGSLWAAVVGSLVLAAGCYPHNCDGDLVHYGRGPNEGHLVDANTWESTAVEAEWLPFPHGRIYDVDLAALGDRIPSLVIPYISANQNPIAIGDNFTIGSGNLTQISGTTNAHVAVANGTCGDYYLRLVVIAPPLPPVSTVDAGASEGGTP
jgi:hypothetical protein